MRYFLDPEDPNLLKIDLGWGICTAWVSEFHDDPKMAMERIRQTTIVDIADRLLFLGRWNNLIGMMEEGEVTADDVIGFLTSYTASAGIDRVKRLIFSFFGKDIDPDEQTQLYKDVALMAEDLRKFFAGQADNPPRMIVSPHFFNELLAPKED